MSAVAQTSPAAAKLLKSVCKLPPSIRQSILLHQPRPQSQLLTLRTHPLFRRYASTQPARVKQQSQNEPLIAAPTESSGPLLNRLPNRALPPVYTGLSPTARLWLKTLPLFILLITLSSLSIFNYQKSSSSTVNSILYALRTSPTVREILGDEIYFRSRIPWISGELNQLHGSIDISFWVKGTKRTGKVRFVSVRKRRDGYFETLEWSLTDDTGRTVQLLEVEGTLDPMAANKVGEEELLDM
ncbi:cytochrome oxidase assembly protein 1 [Neophaeococcomyces mojaviensis]|uniref:Cytochrome oxidase assembly protein 1 n=1 Tax=Neophaeococcomyces mojaviensis TaxID=3383035 RepID=A0ACC3ADK6_9EURO|nr:cytochrome oxidase assembly protein 1 [Knufia sp. JES_112]